MKRYADMLLLPHPVSKKRPRMSVHDRAAQFAPFAALTGSEDAIGEAGRLTQQPVFLTEDAMAEVNSALCALQNCLAQRPEVQLIYFCPDSRKAGGAVMTVSGVVKKIDRYASALILENGLQVPFENLIGLHFLEYKGKI